MLKSTLIVLGLALGMAVPAAQAEGLYKGPSRTVDRSQEPAEYGKMGNFYLGVLGGHSWGDIEGAETDDFVAGLYLEARFRRPNSILAWGAEIDVLRTNLSTTFEKGETQFTVNQDWLASARLKGGIQITPIVFGYVTGGYAWSDLSDGGVYGAGLELNLVGNWVGRAEVLRYELEDSPQTVGRFGLGYRF